MFSYFDQHALFSGCAPLFSGEAESLFTLSPGEEEELVAGGYQLRHLTRVGEREGLVPALWICKGDRRARRRGRKVYEYLGYLFGPEVFTKLFLPGANGYRQRLHEKWNLQRIRFAKLREDPSTGIWRLYRRREAGCRIARMILSQEHRHRAGPFHGEDWNADITDLAEEGSWHYLWETFPEEPPLEPSEAQQFWQWWAREILPLHPGKRSWGYVYVDED
tara:strand:+ start:2311 stop:2970 length:660 start_codon:yes stop_codon:yes gene_type:complete